MFIGNIASQTRDKHIKFMKIIFEVIIYDKSISKLPNFVKILGFISIFSQKFVVLLGRFSACLLANNRNGI